MAREKKQEAPAPGAPMWMTTFSDMMTLVLCFFVLLYSMSSIDQAKWQSVVQAFSGNAGLFDYFNSVIAGQASSGEASEGEAEEEFDAAGQWEIIGQQVTSEMQELEKELGLSDIYVEVSATEIVINLEGDLLFDSGKDVLKPEAQELLLQVMNKAVLPFTASYKEIRIEGHTDRVPINTAQFRSNQYLSAARAISAANFIMANYPEVPEEMIGYIGYGETRPIVISDQPNQPKNRRVVLVLIKDPRIEADIRREQDTAPSPSP